MYFCCFLCAACLPASLNAWPNFQTTCAMALMFTLQHEFELSTIPSIPSNRYVSGLC